MDNPNKIMVPILGASDEAIKAASDCLGVSFPDQLKEIWAISNGLELAGGWIMFPVFDKANPRKTSNHIVYANTKGRWQYMPEDLVSIASNETGNQLVLEKVENELMPEVFVWYHESNRIKKWGKGLDYIKDRAFARVSKINAKVQKGVNRKS
ncbi:MAG: SMI1/KNR4 family protein [Desulfitobacterium sp.]